MSSQRALYIEATSGGDASSTIAANEAVYEQAWGTISTMSYDPTGGMRFDGRARAREWSARKKAAFSAPETFSTSRGMIRAIQGLFEAIDDPWAQYVDAEDGSVRSLSVLDDLAVEDAGDGLEIVSVVPGSPAEVADLRVGDVILRVDGRSTFAAPAGPRASPLRSWSPPRQGRTTTVVLDVSRAGGMRRRVALANPRPSPQFSTTVLDDGATYVRIGSFSRSTTTRLAEVLASTSGNSLVVDLRNALGGTLQEAMLSSALFFDDAYFTTPSTSTFAKPYGNRHSSTDATAGLTPLLFTVNSRGEYTDHDVDEYRTDPRYPAKPPPEKLVRKPPAAVHVLVNRGTASAAEAFAASLRDNGVADLVGETTFGKALIQHSFPLPDGGKLKLTVAEFLTPKQQHLAPTRLADLRVTAGPKRRGGLPVDRLCQPGPVADPRDDPCVQLALRRPETLP